jgi:uncharacterized protein YuzE
VSQDDSNGRDPDITGVEFSVVFCSSSRTCSVESVLDLDPEGFVIGIEILGVVSECHLARGPSPENVKRVGVVSVSIDPDADAMYVRLRDGTSTRQVVRPAFLMAADDALAGIRVLPALDS